MGFDNRDIIGQVFNEGLTIDPNSTKGRILTSATCLFQRKGFLRTTLTEIAEETNISVHQLFQYFSSKQAILCYVMRVTLLLTAANLSMVLRAEHRNRTRLIKCIHHELESIHGYNGVSYQFMVGEWKHLDEDHQMELLMLRETYERLWLELLEQIRQDGLTSMDSFILRRFIFGSLIHTTTWFKSDGMMGMEELAFQIARLVLGDGQPQDKRRPKLSVV